MPLPAAAKTQRVFTYDTQKYPWRALVAAILGVAEDDLARVHEHILPGGNGPPRSSRNAYNKRWRTATSGGAGGRTCKADFEHKST